MHRSHSIVPIVALCAGMLALAACGGSRSDSERTPAAGLLRLESDRPESLRTEQRVVRSLAITPELEGIELREGAGEVLHDRRAGKEEEEWLLVLRGPGPHVVSLKGPFEARSFERLAIEMDTSDRVRVQARALLEKGGRPNSATVVAEGSPRRQVLLLDLPHLRLGQSPVEELELQFTGNHGAVGLKSVDWISRPLENWLPHAGATPRAVELDGQLRSVVGVTSGETLRAGFEVGIGHVLELSYGVPRSLGILVGEARLLLRMSGDQGGSLLRELPLPGLNDDAGWAQARIPLDALAGEAVELELKVVAPGGVPALCALGTLRVRDPLDRASLVFLLSSDTHRADHVGIAGLGVEIDTPVMDGFAQRGVWFSNCFSSTNVTNPSHVSLMTGLNPRDHGVVTNTMGLGAEASTLAEAFAQAGWATLGVVSNSSLGQGRGDLHQGFERFARPMLSNPGDAAEAVDTLLEWLPDTEGVPTFVWMHVFDAHEPYAAPDPALVDRYYPAGKDAFDPALPALEGIGPENLPESLAGLRDLAWPRAAYRAEITYLDAELGRLTSRERFDGAIVALTADHGESLDTHEIYYSHSDLYPDSLHVPLILSWPAAPGGQRIAHGVQQVSVGRTLLDLAGLEAVDFPGANLFEQAAGEPRFALAAGKRVAALTAGPWHLTLHLRRHHNPRSSLPSVAHLVRLFDLESDPGCEHDLVASGEELERARRMREILIEWLNSARGTGWGSEGDRSPEVLAELRGLGYVTDEPAVDAEMLMDPDCDCEECARFR